MKLMLISSVLFLYPVILRAYSDNSDCSGITTEREQLGRSSSVSSWISENLGKFLFQDSKYANLRKKGKKLVKVNQNPSVRTGINLTKIYF
jgi:hypothetical protein